jgi:hypothetical protein
VIGASGSGRTWSRRRWPARAGVALLALALSACGAVRVKPQPVLPHALVVPMPTRVALVIPKDLRTYVHKESRWGVDWVVDLGSGHSRLLHDQFHDCFSDVVEVSDLDEARRAAGLKGIFEYHIEQFSFTTSQETGRYYAATIRYKVKVYTPQAELVDTYTLTGYGNSLYSGLSSTTPLEHASAAAMRDAAAKFLVQFPQLPVGKRLAQNEVLVVDTANPGAGEIDAVPIDDPVAALETVAPTPATPVPPTPPVTSAESR